MATSDCGRSSKAQVPLSPQQHNIGSQLFTASNLCASLPTVLSFPTELLHEIFIRITDPTTFLSLSLVNHRFKNTATSHYTRTSFTNHWFITHCNDTTAPSIIETFVRSIRRHGQYPDYFEWGTKFQTCHFVKFNFMVIDAFPSEYTTYSHAWKEVYLNRIAKSTPANYTMDTLIPFESIKLDVEDVVLAWNIYQTWLDRRAVRSDKAMARYFNTLLQYKVGGRMACRCGIDTPSNTTATLSQG